MKRAANLEQERSKKRIDIEQTSIAQSNGEKEEALKRFASMKASARNASEEESQQMISLLQSWNMLETYGPQLASLMPEIHCLLSGISHEQQDKSSVATRLPYIVVSSHP